MPRRTLQPIPRSLASNRDPSFRRQNALFDQGIWDRLDRVQVLGDDYVGHDGCVNALSWSDDGNTLLSGSDDRRICIWGPDTSSDSSSTSPHPLKLLESIYTGHRANIFSAKYLPNASTPTIVTCAGDSEVRVFDVEKLSRLEMGRRIGDLDGVSGPGVRVLRCHIDRTKRIATENSPFMFLTVAEDGTVRQHDLRRPHRCRTECPEPLFRAPKGIDLYSLSVSAAAPHIFAVAGRSDCAFICDRRMPEHHSPSWGSNMKSSGQVHCVRRLGLSEEEWRTVEVTPEGRTIRSERHITSVKMNADQADEAICAFAGHSTALFSIHDDPSTTSMRARSSSPIVNNSKPGQQRFNHADFLLSSSSNTPTSLPIITEAEPGGSSPSVAVAATKRRSSQASPEAGPSRVRQRVEDASFGLRASAEEHEEDDRREIQIEEVDEDEEAADELERILRGFGGNTASNIASRLLLSTSDADDRQRQSIPQIYPPTRPSRFGDPDDNLDDQLDDEVDEEDDWDIDEDDVDDEDGDVETDEDDMDDMVLGEEDESDDEEYGGGSSLSDLGEFGNVEKIMPRMCYKGARNMETVKDCNFLGALSDKIASGSDDGNFFVWDKATGRLDGIWEGDGSVVNVMEQHPTLPLVAVSGIDNTVKIFGPVSSPLSLNTSMLRTHNSERILGANTDRRRATRPTAYAGILQMLMDRGATVRDGQLYQGDEVAPECTTQ